MEREWGEWEGVGRRGENGNFHNLINFEKKLEINVSHDPTLSLLGIYLKDAQSFHKDMCSTIFTAAFFLS